MKDNPPAKSHDPISSSEFYSHLFASLGDLNRLLTNSEYLKLQQEIDHHLSAAAENANSADFLLPAIRFKLYALLALTS
ncbi:MAG: hypothetical protein GXY49_02650 [Syntrophomonadaceae bacterium]|nr:hypothetical protein [Syntrophomonadaceae bacterium]